MLDIMIQLWKFSDAPVNYQRIHKSPFMPEWLAAVPRGCKQTDLASLLALRCRDKYQIDDGTTIFVGDEPVSEDTETAGAKGKG